MFTIALIGPDGAGKTTISQGIQKSITLPLKYLYMGVNTSSSNRMLPTTRLAAALKHAASGHREWEGTPDLSQPKAPPKGLIKRTKAGIRAGLRLANRLFEECYRQGLSWYYQARGNVVLYDRHFFFDYYPFDIAPAASDIPLSRRLHGLFLKYIYPKPDLVIYLDAPAEVLFARKGEGTIESLERRRKEYLQMGKQVKHFVVVDACQPVDQVTSEVNRKIYEFSAARGIKNIKSRKVKNA